MTAPLETLSLHLLALTQAIQNSPTQPALSVVLTPWGMCYQKSLMGYFWKTCNHASNHLFPQDLQAHLLQIIRHTLVPLFNQAVSSAYDARQFRIHDHLWQLNAALKKNLEESDRNRQRSLYEERLKRELKDSVEPWEHYLKDFDQKSQPLSEKEKSASRHLILQFFQSTDFFWPLVVKERPGQLSFRAAVDPFLQGAGGDKPRLLDLPLFKALKREKSWVELEGILEEPIPVNEWAKLAKRGDPSSLSLKDKMTLKNWVNALNRCHRQVTPRQLLHVLTDVISLLRIQGSSSVTLSDLLLWLDKAECPLLEEEDDSHMNGRERLKPESKITCNGSELVLGGLLSPQKAAGEKDRYKIFALPGHPDKVVKIACNRFLLLLESEKAKDPNAHCESEIRCAEIKKDAGFGSGLDEEGRCVVLERLNPLLKTNPCTWKSRTIKLEKQEEGMAFVLAKYLAFLRRTETSICDFSLSYVMQDQTGKLKSTRLLKKGKEKGDYKEWERLCIEIAKGNLFVLCFLLQVSKLYQHQKALDYRTLVKETWETDTQENTFVDSVCEEAKKLHQECLRIIIARLREQGLYSSIKILKEDVEDKLFESLKSVYEASPTAAYFSPSFKEQVIAHYFFETPSSLVLPPIDAEAKKYYESQRDRLDRDNE